MASKIISFRLSDYEIEILQSLQTPEDEGSLNITTARLVRGFLGTSTDANKPVDNPALQEMIKREVESAIADVRRELDEHLGELAA